MMTSYQVAIATPFIAIIAAYNPGLGLIYSPSAIAYNALYCTGCTFDPSGILHFSCTQIKRSPSNIL